MSHLALFLFGPPRMERDGEIINVDTRKATALISYLAITRQRHSRDALAALLWPDYDQPHARATLRRTLSALNKALAGTWLSIDRETVGLDQQASFWLDVDEFQGYLAECRKHNHPASEVCSACIEPLTKAVKLYRDDFMAGFSLHDSSNFDDWQFYQADSLRRDLAQAHNMLGILASSQGDIEQAHYHLEHSLALADNLNYPSIRAAALNNLALVYKANGAIERALELTEAALALSTAQGDRHREAALHSNMADLLHDAKRAEDSMIHLKRTVSIYAEIGVEAGAMQSEIWKLAEW